MRPSSPAAPLPKTLRRKVESAIERTASNDRMIVNLAFNYGGRSEIVQAVRKIVATGIPAEEVTEEIISDNLYTAGQPEPDLIIRTSGVVRASNFLIWQGAYSEWYFTPAFWPDFDAEELLKALQYFGRKERRFGLVSEQIT